MTPEEQNYSLDQVREDMEERWRSSRNAHRFLGVSLLLLVAVMGVLVWIAYPKIKRDDAAVAGLPELQQSVDAVGAKTTANEGQIADWSGRQEQFRAEMTQGLAAVRERLASTAKQVQASASELVDKARAEIGDQMDGLSARLTTVERSQDAAQVQVAALRQELDQAREKISAQDRQLSALRADMDNGVKQNASGIADANRQIQAMTTRQSRDRGDFDAFSSKMARARVDFEVNKNQPQEIVRGISVGVNKTNVNYQRVNGWVSAPDGHTIWLRDLAVQEPVVLTSSGDGRTHQLVITRVTQNSVIGYLVVPADSISTAGVASSVGE